MPEIMKILDGALRHDAKQAYEYAGMLAELLEQAGERGQARRIRERLARVPIQQVSPAAKLSMHGLPVDQASRLNTLDEYRPTKADLEVLLSDSIQKRLDEFLQSIRFHAELDRAGVAQPSRLLLHGPPGCGKTLTASLIAAELDVPLLTVRCDTLVSSLLGQTGKNLRSVFEHAERRPCVLFLDEFDALAKRRADEREVGELQRVVIALLQNIDALPDETVLVAATNHAELLDPAVWRRFAFRLQLPLPNARLRRQMWQKHLDHLAGNDIKWNLLVELSEGLSGAAIEQVAKDTLRSTIISAAAQVDEHELLRRLGLTQAMQQQVMLSSVADEVKWLRSWQPKLFSLRVLERLYSLSKRQIDNIIKGTAHAESDHSGRFSE